MVINLRIKELREYHNLTQEQLGKIIGQTKSNISKYENGNLEPSIQVLKGLASFFDVTIDYLLGHSDSKKETTNNKIHSQELITNIDNLSPESKKELEKYIQLLKLKDTLDKSKDEMSSHLTPNVSEDK